MPATQTIEEIVAALEKKCGDATTFEARDEARYILDKAFTAWAQKSQT